MDTSQVRRLYNIRINLLDMLEDRGYHQESLDIHRQMTFDEFKDNYKKRNFDVRVDHSTLNQEIIVYYSDINGSRIKKDDLLKGASVAINTRKPDKNTVLLILINDPKMQAHIRTLISEFHAKYRAGKSDGEKISIETMPYRNLTYNPTKHNLVPEHRLITDKDQIDAILSKYNTSKDKLPKILLNDVISKWFGGKLGNIFVIRRMTDRNRSTYYFRTVALRQN